MNDRSYERLMIAFLLVVIVIQAVFAAFPGIDLAVSGHFANGTAGFAWNTGPLQTVNLVLRRLAELLAVGLVLWCILGGLTGKLRGDALTAWAYAASVVVLASGVIANLLLKGHIGRARPVSVAEFGGELHFTPAWQITDQCAHNCSFASGEVSLAASLSIAAVVLFWPRLKNARWRFMAIVVATAYVGLIMLLRIGLGRHFLSDTIFAVLFSGAVALALYPLMRVSRARLAFDPQLPVLVCRRQYEKGRAQAQAWLKRAT
ncbi:MAG: phosphatase PAP2 family protein [Paracoccaceae bacterium]